MTYLLEANKTPELSWASRHKSKLRFSRRMRCWGEREICLWFLWEPVFAETLSFGPCQVRQCGSPRVLIDAVNAKDWQWLHVAETWLSARCCYLQDRFRQLMSRSWANIYRSFILDSCLGRSIAMILPNLSSVVNQENPAMFATPSVWDACMISNGLSTSRRYISVPFGRYLNLSFGACSYCSGTIAVVIMFSSLKSPSYWFVYM